MALWKITAKANWMWGKDRLTKGMFIEVSSGTTPPLGLTANQEMLAHSFNAKYGTSIDKSKMNSSHFSCEKIG